MSATALASTPRRGALRWPPRAHCGVLAAGVAVVTVLSSLVPRAVRAQSTAPATPARLDEGSFTVLRNGQRVGREQFSVQRTVSADGATLALRAEAAEGDRRSAVRLEADSAGTPVRYTIEVRRGAETTLRLGGQRVRGRFATLARSSTGEAAREYLLRPLAVVVEEEGLVQYALLVHGRTLAVGDSLTLPSLMPAANRQDTVRLVLEAVDDQVLVAATRLPAQRWRLMAGAEVRLLWSDADGHLLRVRIPSRGFEALRDDVPR